MQTVIIPDAEGRSLTARVDIEDGWIVLHSRSGTGSSARNPDYRPALEAILARLGAWGVDFEIFHDAERAQVQALPLERRRIASAADLSGTIAERFNNVIRRMNAGSSSHGAWRRIRISASGIQEDAIRQILQSDGRTSATSRGVPPVDRIMAAAQYQVTDDHIHRAIERLLAGEDAPNFAESRDFDVIVSDGSRLAPKKVFGLALEEVVGFPTFPRHFSAGIDQPSFKKIEAAGYRIVRKGEVPGTSALPTTSTSSEVPAADEERQWAEGSPKRVAHLKRERAPGLAKVKREAFLALHGRLFCEECHFDPVKEHGNGYLGVGLDVHHTKPLSEAGDGQTTELSDLDLLCARCHRIEHRRMALAKE